MDLYVDEWILKFSVECTRPLNECLKILNERPLVVMCYEGV